MTELGDSYSGGRVALISIPHEAELKVPLRSEDVYTGHKDNQTSTFPENNSV